MATYSKEQNTVIALWVLAMQYRDDPRGAIQGATAPAIIADTVNRLGETHTSDSILLHAHGYDRLLTGRRIDRTITDLQRSICAELKESGVVSRVYETGLVA